MLLTNTYFLYCIIFILLLYIIWREIYNSKRLWLLETLLHETSHELAAFDENMRFLFVSKGSVKNPEMRKWLIGRTEMDYWTQKRNMPEIGLKRFKEFSQAIKMNQERIIEETILDREGQERTFRRLLKPIYDKNDKFLVALGYSIELTAILKKEKELAKLNKILEQSNEALDNFAYVASHDLKTPLRNISLFMQLYAKKHANHFDEQDEKYINVVIDSAKYMNNLIELLLKYATLENNLGTPQSVNLDKLVHFITENLKLNDSKNTLQFTLQPLPILIAHEPFIIQLFQNIIENGIQYNNSEVKVIDIFVKMENEKTIFCIYDNGMGIPQNGGDKIFKMFQRLHNKTDFSGQGIGLTICKRIVEMYEGTIWYETTAQGTTFYFTLPACMQ